MGHCEHGFLMGGYLIIPGVRQAYAYNDAKMTCREYLQNSLHPAGRALTSD